MTDKEIKLLCAWMPISSIRRAMRKYIKEHITYYTTLLEKLNILENKLITGNKTLDTINPSTLSNYTINIPSQKSSFTPDTNYNNYTYLKKEYIKHITDLYLKSKNQAIDYNFVDLKAFQDALCTAFIDQMFTNSAKILEVGGGFSRVLPLFQNKHECWNIDKFEGNGNGPKVQPSNCNYNIVYDYMGSFNTELPNNYFDLVFSISALEHVPEDTKLFENIMQDINRVLKPGGYSVHCFDIVEHSINKTFWSNSFVPFLFKNIKTLNSCESFSFLPDNENIIFMSQKKYETTWIHTTKKSYLDFGRPTSLQVFWRKEIL